MGTPPENHIITMARNKIFSFTVTNHQPCQASTMVQSWSSYPGLSKFEAMPDDVLESRCLTTCFSLTLTSTISPSITINIESWGVFITSFSWPHCLKDPSTQLPLHTDWHNRKLFVNGKKLHLNSATTLYCNSNQVSITQIHYDLHQEAFPPFWKFKIHVHLVSHCILTVS